MGITLFVEKLNEDKSMGYTTNHAMMLENASRVRIKNIENTDDIVGLVFQAGRYVATILTDINNEVGMMFIDLKKDRQKAIQMSTQFVGEAKELFMKNFEAVSKNYEENYNLIELVQDNSFAPNIIAN
ncbi:hypothetical protein HNQ91_002992 [Filimonas zeae]|uniref:Uncharacterized protein n=1 Tax=Filimonas zeae TaxID=1737353 RepID=A0A917IZH8_9BACT|nr:hypothetical protein [Filimonas zeae]MDR6339927.1 hypothetical protein [Filimonas zeae]GGH70328.1 hypothetical protein GCM10011379_28490 [Filimonas zeae]